jgi:hypothetical protein
MRLVPKIRTGFPKEISMPERPLNPDAVDLEAAFFAQEMTSSARHSARSSSRTTTSTWNTCSIWESAPKRLWP